MTPFVSGAPPGVNQTEKEVRVIAYRMGPKTYGIATTRYDLTAEQIATIGKLRWEIQVFFRLWKRHLKGYHLMARSAYGFMVQILTGLTIDLLLAIYCEEQFGEKASIIKRVRQLRIEIRYQPLIADNLVFEPKPNMNRYSIAAKT